MKNVATLVEISMGQAHGPGAEIGAEFTEFGAGSRKFGAEL